ncbi:hypothetical protein GGI42DRAFT_142051 [Trichoderma sp. SZMC 28013]
MGNNGGRFISLFTTCFFIALHNGLPANARPLYPGTWSVFLVYFFFIICSPAFFVLLQIWLELDWVLFICFFLSCLSFFVAFFIIHEIDYGVVCLCGAWSMELMGLRDDWNALHGIE